MITFNGEVVTFGLDPVTRSLVSGSHVVLQTDPISQAYDYHALWHDLHTSIETQEQFESWVARVPNFGCGCRRELDGYLAENPVDYDNIYDWGVSLHNWVNVRLGKPLWTKPDSSLPSEKDSGQ